MASSRKQYGDLAASLASVAIAGLFGGPVAGSQELLNQAIPTVRKSFERDEKARKLRQELTESIENWAQNEHIDKNMVRAGLEEALSTVGTSGIDAGSIADLENNPARVYEEVVRRAKEKDRYWGTEAHYVVAERAILQTYKSLIEQYSSKEPVLFPILRSLRGHLDERIDSMEKMLEEIHGSLVAEATRADVRKYLRLRINDWDKHLWLPTEKTPSSMERRLRVRTDEDSSDHKEFDADDLTQAFSDKRVLVVLGGPGSGKTWLARRYAREAARTAMDQLLDPNVPLDRIEIPLFTTWDTWANQNGESRQALFEAAFSSNLGHSDLGGTDIINRLERRITNGHIKVLAIVDSLDEAADKTRQSARFKELTSIEDWRAIVTSRPAAWRATRSQGEKGACVVDLLDLRYPADVEGFVDAWFEGESSRASALKQEIDHRSELRRSAVVPLLLTFYCILADSDLEDGIGLPAKRRELYQRLIEHLLEGQWRHNAPGPDRFPDMEVCLHRLQEWAWESVKDSNTPAGLGKWGDTFIPTIKPNDGVARDIKAIAPLDGSGRQRRFIHRTIQEHLVAEYIASLPTPKAMEVLLPHLWFDSDWEVAAPAAIAAHHSRLPGKLLESLFEKVMPFIDDLPRQKALSEFARLLGLAVKENGGPVDFWVTGNPVIKDGRTRILSSLLWSISDARSYELLNLIEILLRFGPSEVERRQAVQRILQLLPTASLYEASRLMEAMLALGPSEVERREIIQRILEVIATVDSSKASRLVEAMLALGPSEVERREIIQRILEVIATVDSSEVFRLVEAMLALGPSEVERREIIQRILEVIATVNSRKIPVLVEVVVELGPSEVERRQAVQRILQLLPIASLYEVSRLVEAMLALGPSEVERRQAVQRILQRLPTFDPSKVSRLVEVVVKLSPSEVERRQAVQRILQRLPTFGPSKDSRLAEEMLALGPSEVERRQAVQRILQLLPIASLYEVSRLVEEMLALGPSEVERREFIQRILEVIATVDSSTASRLVEVVVKLSPSEVERRQAVQRLLEVIATVPSSKVSRLVEVMVALGPSEVERKQAVQRILQRLYTFDPSEDSRLAEEMLALGPSEVERREFIQRILEVIATVDSSTASRLVEVMLAFGPSEVERRQAVQRLLEVIATVPSSKVSRLVEVMVALGPSEGERKQAVQRILQLLPTADSDEVALLVEVVSKFALSAAEGQEVTQAIVRALPTTDRKTAQNLVRRFREVNPLDIWLRWLQEPAQPTL